LQGQGVERGVFITASRFTQSAKDYAQKLLGKVILRDGQELATLMIRYKVGIQVRQTLEIISIESDPFPTSPITFSGYIFSYCHHSFYPNFYSKVLNC